MTRLRAEVMRLRKNWWLAHGYAAHGSMSALYGDDGEMQCNACLIDFKRTPVEDIELRLYELANTRLRATLPSQVVRVVRDDTSRPMATYWWRFVGGELQWSYEQRDWHRLAADNGFSLTVERVRLLADLMANPTESRATLPPPGARP